MKQVFIFWFYCDIQFSVMFLCVIKELLCLDTGVGVE